MGLEQALLSDAIALYQDTWPAIKHLVFESVRMNVAFYSLILCSRLQPKRRDIQLLGLLEQTERYLSSRSQRRKWKRRATKLTLAFVMMLTEVSVGANIAVRSGTVATPSSSLSFYTMIQHASEYSPRMRQTGKNEQDARE